MADNKLIVAMLSLISLGSGLTGVCWHESIIIEMERKIVRMHIALDHQPVFLEITLVPSTMIANF